MYLRPGKEKRGICPSPRTILSTYTNAETVTVVGANGRNIISAVEDTRLAIADEDFSAAVVESSDAIDDSAA